MSSLRFQRCIDLSAIPSEWILKRLTLDWAGRPLLLFCEGKPPKPDARAGQDARSRWYQIPPKAHHLVYCESGKLLTVAFDRSRGLSTFHVQPFEGGWMLGEPRGGQTTVYEANGAVRFTLDLGDASEDLQTTPDGRIWVSYFDEGVFGGGIGRQGLVCFDATGKPVFEFADFAERNGLPTICDCYAMNVDETGAVWISYYTDFPLVCLSGFEIERVWSDFGVLGNSFAVREDEVVYIRDKRLTAKKFTSSPEFEPITMSAEDEAGNSLVPASTLYTDVAARGRSFLINTGQAIYTICG